MWFQGCGSLCTVSYYGILFDDYLDAYLQTPIVISIMLIFYGLLFILIENWNKKRTPTTMALSDISYKTAILIGHFKCYHLYPAHPRSGATIIGALLIGVSRVAAAEFTFFLAVPTMLGASAFKLLKFGFEFTSAELLALVLGMAVALAVSVLVIKFLMNFIKKHDFKVFGWYRNCAWYTCCTYKILIMRFLCARIKMPVGPLRSAGIFVSGDGKQPRDSRCRSPPDFSLHGEFCKLNLQEVNNGI